jgi:hypothetical protein
MSEINFFDYPIEQNTNLCYLLDFHGDDHDYLSIKIWQSKYSIYNDDHETKNAVMKVISKDDLKAIGCKNPDIYVKSRNDDRIIITPNKTRRQSEEYKRLKRKTKHETAIRASDIVGDDWRNKIPVLSFSSAIYLIEQRTESEQARFFELLESGKVKTIVKICSTSKIKVAVFYQLNS